MIAAFKPTEFVKAMATPNKASSLTYDLVIVGGGSAGLTAAKLSGKTLKKSTLIIEADRLGGDCTWTGLCLFSLFTLL
jgi:ribulose 1,5-bisphosphate synthetase/thiazole synthase